MDTITAITRSKSVEILELLNTTKEIHFNSILKEVGASPSSANRSLNDLIEAGLVIRREEGSSRTSKVYYSISEKGIVALELFKKFSDLDIQHPKK